MQQDPSQDPLADARRLQAEGQQLAALALLERHLHNKDCGVRLRECLLAEREYGRAAIVAARLAQDTDVEAAVSRAVLALLEGSPERAVSECRAALAQDPANAHALNHLARALFNLGQTESAIAAFRGALDCVPDYAEAWSNLGFALRACGQIAPAIAAFERALGLAAGFRRARLELGITLYNAERVESALACFETLLRSDDADAEALGYSGLCLHLLGRFSEARVRYRRALDQEPENALILYYLGTLLNEEMDGQGARESLQASLRLDPGNGDAWAELAAVMEQDNHVDEAADVVQHGLQQAPGHAPLLLEKATIERRRGNARGALATLAALDSACLTLRQQERYQFQLGFAYDRADDADAAMRAFCTANALAAASPRRKAVDATAFSRRCERLGRWLAAGAPGIAGPASADEDLGEDLCFLIGFPRSGTTLLDTMLDAHPELASIEERPTLERLVDRLVDLGPGYPDCIAALDDDAIRALRQCYRAETARYLDAAAPRRLVDKLGLRLMHAGLIQRLFPRARLLFALRHPCDVVLSNFMQFYVENEAFVHFDTLADSAATYDRVMGLWQELLPHLTLPLHYLRYESLVTEPEATLREVCSFLEVDADGAMLDLDARLASRERVRTNSYQQVAEPLYTRAVGRWQRYRAHLEPVLPLLRPHAERFGYVIPAMQGATG